MFQEIDYVYAVYQAKSFTGAARKLYLSQPALSAMVKKAEKKLGTPIFDRSTSPLSLTVAGRYYIDQCEKILAIQKETAEYFNRLASPEVSELRLGGSAFFQIYVFPSILADFRREYPNINVSWVEAPNQALIQKLEDDQIDAFPEVDDLHSSTITGIKWDEEHLMLAVPASWDVNERLTDYRVKAEDIRHSGHIPDSIPAIDPVEFRDYPFILMREGNDTYSRAITICQNAGFSPKKFSMSTDQMLTAYYLAEQGNGIVLMRDSIVQLLSSTSDSMFFYRLKDPAAIRPVYLYYRKSNQNLSALLAFRAFISNYKDNNSCR